MRYIKQLWRELCSAPLFGIVTIAGTALSLFLIMVAMMMEDVKVMPLAPESNRARFLYTGRQKLTGIENNEGRTFETPYPYRTICELFDSIPGMEAFAIYSQGCRPQMVWGGDRKQFMADFLEVNDGFWKVFDFTFLAGRPFTTEEYVSGARLAVITEEVARRMFGSLDGAVGREITINRFPPYQPFKVVGVVRDVPTVADTAYGQIWLPLTAMGRTTDDNITGSVNGVILADREGRREEVRAEYLRRREIVNKRLKEVSMQHYDLGAPYLVSEFRTAMWNGFRDSVDMDKVKFYTVIVILLLVPAINISNMTQSRLRRRIKEIGVRRAFGCTRGRMIREILTENFFLTLAGGVVGMLASLVFVWLSADYLWSNYDGAASGSFVSIATLLDWRIALYTIGACFVLNLLSNGVPAWRAARLNPVEAIGGLQK